MALDGSIRISRFKEADQRVVGTAGASWSLGDALFLEALAAAAHSGNVAEVFALAGDCYFDRLVRHAKTLVLQAQRRAVPREIRPAPFAPANDNERALVAEYLRLKLTSRHLRHGTIPGLGAKYGISGERAYRMCNYAWNRKNRELAKKRKAAANAS